ncbi:MAG: peptidoglycan-binding protein [Oscillospiraceae bacterium]|nr:peptidoglycan-binding protein [Oscillospiraceae bacterium]
MSSRPVKAGPINRIEVKQTVRHANPLKRLLAVTLAILMLTGIAGVGYAAEPGAISAYSLTLTRSLYQGRVGADVRAAQTILKELGYYTGSIDGIYGSKTTAAVKAFQTRNGLPADGQIGNSTFQRMISPSAIKNGASSSGGAVRSYLRYGDTGSSVLQMQRALQSLGYYNGPLSGNFLSQTLAAVKSFQSRNGLVVDGLAGNKTLTLLYSGKALPYYVYQPTQPPVYWPTPKPTAKPTPTPAGQRLLRYGMSGDDVAAVQSRLFQLGYYYASSIRGNFDQATLNAVKLFQSYNGLNPDGIIGPQTWTKLFSQSAVPYYYAQPTKTPGGWRPPTSKPTAKPTSKPTTKPPSATQTPPPNAWTDLSNGSTGDLVSGVQRRLRELGYYNYNDPISGHFNDKTEDAVRLFQQNNGLNGTGVVNEGTWWKLFDASARSYEQPPTPVPPTPTPAPTATQPLPPLLSKPRVYYEGGIDLIIEPESGVYNYEIELYVTDASGNFIPDSRRYTETVSTMIALSFGEVNIHGYLVPGTTLHWIVTPVDAYNRKGETAQGSFTMKTQ